MDADTATADSTMGTRSKNKLYIATPMYGGQCMVTYAQSLLETSRTLARAGIGARYEFVANESLIQRARNLIAHQFYHTAPDCTHLLFVDADIGFDYTQLERLLTRSSGVENDGAVLTGVYCKKHVDWERVRAKATGTHRTVEGALTAGLDYNINADTRDLANVQDGFATVLDAATGFMLIPRRVLARLYEAYAPTLSCINDLAGAGTASAGSYVAVFDCMICPQSGRYLSEDFSFTRRCQEQGVPVRSDLCSKLSHTGTLTLRNDFEDVLHL